MLRSIAGQVAWVTGGGSGIGAAAATALARAGAAVVLTGRTRTALEGTANEIAAVGGRALIAEADVAKPDEIRGVCEQIETEFGHCEILVNSAGFNIRDRHWADVSADGFASVIGADLLGPFHAAQAMLPMMRAQKDGLIIHVASWAGRYVIPLTGPAYTAAKYALRAMSESLNQEEFVNGVRSVCLCPGEVATPILDRRPTPVSAEERARMLQASDLGGMIAFVAQLEPRICMNELLVSPTWNRLHYSSQPI